MRSVLAATLLCLAAACAGEEQSSVSSAPASITSAPASTSPTTTTSGTTPATSAVTSPPTSATTSTTSTIATTSTLPADAVTPEGFEQVAATATAADGTVCELCLWLADDGDRRALGLMYVTDLGGHDGMLFRYSAPTTGAFWMKNTVMPLSIAFFDESGAFMDAFDMEPCTADPCQTYATPNGFVYAVEVPQGGLEALAMTPGSVLAVSDLRCQ